jgi:hypothetical protein
MPVPKKGTISPSGDGAVTLWLPSSIAMSLRSSTCVDGLAAKEIVLRVADCSDSLHNLRRCARELFMIKREKRKNNDGQRLQTRALTTLKALQDKRDRFADRYRRSHAAWLALDPEQMFEGGKWKGVLLELNPTDMIYPGDFAEADGDGEAINSMGRNGKRRRGEGDTPVRWLWRQMQDARDIPGLDGSASEEDVFKRKIYYP